MHYTRAVLPLTLTLLLAACAPSASETSTARERPGTAGSAVVDTTTDVRPPEVTTTGANAAFDLVATRDGRPVQTRFEDGFHYVDTPDYVLGLSFSPNELLSVDNAAYEAYQENDEGLGAVGLFLRVLESGPTGFQFSVANNSQSPIQIVWDETAIVTVDGSSSRVIHESVRYSEMNNSQPPTVVPPGARVDEYAGPTNLITLNDEWTTAALVSDFDVGSRVSLFLALNVNGERQNLNFAFTANRSNELFRGGEDFSTLNQPTN